MSIIAAIDPGPEQSGWVLVDDKTMSVVEHDVRDNDTIIYGGLLKRCPTTVVEMIQPIGQTVGREVFWTCVQIGRFWREWIEHAWHPSGFLLIHRSLVRRHLCPGVPSGRADSAIRAALIDRYGPTKQRAIGLKKTPGPLYGVKTHAWAALGVAVTYIDIMKEGLYDEPGTRGEIVRRHLAPVESYLHQTGKRHGVG